MVSFTRKFPNLTLVFSSVIELLSVLRFSILFITGYNRISWGLKFLRASYSVILGKMIVTQLVKKLAAIIGLTGSFFPQKYYPFDPIHSLLNLIHTYTLLI